MKKYSEDHEWVEIRSEQAVVGISNHAADELGDITFIELPEPGTTYAAGDAMSVVESVKAAADVYCPISGTIAEVNGQLEDKPELVNEAAEGEGWIVKLAEYDAADLDNLMSEEEYEEFIRD